ncbi:MAG: hypothetical protein SGPRY_011646 [Prymnesium sp.]
MFHHKPPASAPSAHSAPLPPTAEVQITTSHTSRGAPPKIAPLLHPGTYATQKLCCARQLDQDVFFYKRHFRHGEFSVDTAHWRDEFLKDAFHAVAELPLWVLVFAYILLYVLAVLVLALLFFIIAHWEENSLYPDASWWSCVQCSWQTLTTVGYGSVSTTGYAASIIGAIAVVASLCFDAAGIGIFYTRFSNASLKSRSILHSERAVICRACEWMPPRLEVRVFHISDHALVDPSVKLTMARWHSGQDGIGRVSIEFVSLPLANKQPDIGFLQYPYSILHFIDKASPLYPYIGFEADGTPFPKAPNSPPPLDPPLPAIPPSLRGVSGSPEAET